MKTFMAVVALCLVVVSRAIAAPATPPTPAPAGGAAPGKRVQTLTRVYDVRDMLMDVRDFPFTGVIGMPPDASAVASGGGGQGLFGGAGQTPDSGPKKRTRAELAEELVNLVTETVEPGTWRQTGGAIGSIRELSGVLIVTHTEEAQKLIADVLRQLRETTGAVRVQAEWLLLSPEEVATLIVDADEKDPAAPKLIDPNRLTRIGNDVVHFRAELSCFNGQTVSTSSGRARTVIYDQEPVVAQSSGAYSPTVKQVQAGVAMEVTPLVIGGTDFAVVEVGSKVAEWHEPTAATQPVILPVTGAEQAKADTAVIDRLNLVSQELRTTVRVPLNRPVLIGGMTFEPTAGEPQGPQLYLILRVTAGSGGA